MKTTGTRCYVCPNKEEETPGYSRSAQPRGDRSSLRSPTATGRLLDGRLVYRPSRGASERAWRRRRYSAVVPWLVSCPLTAYGKRAGGKINNSGLLLFTEHKIGGRHLASLNKTDLTDMGITWALQFFEPCFDSQSDYSFNVSSSKNFTIIFPGLLGLRKMC